MNIYIVPILISGMLCTVLSIITWTFRRRENINKMFAFFTLALGVDSFSYFFWFQFGSVANIDFWMRVTMAVGFMVPIGLILFFIAFTGYDQKLDKRIWKVKVRHFRNTMIVAIILFNVLTLTTNLLIKIPAEPKDVWDVEFGTVGQFMFPLFAIVFAYLATLVIKGYRSSDNPPQKRFILLLAIGTSIWILFGYIGIAFFPPSSELWNAISYMGTTIMAIFYFVAILHHQSDKVYELNLNLERKVEDRTSELQAKNIELKNALNQLTEMQKQVIVQEKMASLGQLVAGITHEFNSPIGAIRSMNNTKSRAIEKLQKTLENLAPQTSGNEKEINNILEIITNADQLIDEGAGRINEIVKNLKNFARLDEAETLKVNIHEGIDSVLSLIKHDLLKDIEVVREYAEIPPIICQPRKLNQAFLNLLKNASQAIDKNGKITISTALVNGMVKIAVADNGKGISSEQLDSLFEPGFTAKGSSVRARLGLSICYQIVQEHNGRIEVESTPGEGSTFTVIIPAVFEDETNSDPGSVDHKITLAN